MNGDVGIARLNFNAARIFEADVPGESVTEQAEVGMHMADEGGAIVSIDEEDGERELLRLRHSIQKPMRGYREVIVVFLCGNIRRLPRSGRCEYLRFPYG